MQSPLVRAARKSPSIAVSVAAFLAVRRQEESKTYRSSMLAFLLTSSTFPRSVTSSPTIRHFPSVLYLLR